jgi:alpha-methylacyl-CoA racemase
MTDAPLAGLRIIDMTRLLPGPAMTMHLADFGADILKVEDTGEGDAMRRFPPTVELASGEQVNTAFEATNRGKRSIAIDLKQAAGRELLLQLAATADALVEGFRPGVLDRLGLGWEAMQRRNPKLVLCSLTGYGQSGPLAQHAGHDLNYCAMTGVLDQNRAAGRPAIPNLQIGDLLGGTLGALSALLIALLAARQTGRGRHVDVAMTDGLLAHHLIPHAAIDAGRTPRAGETLLTGGVPCYGVYETADAKYLALGALELKFWQNFCDAAGLGDLREHHWTRGHAPGSAAAQAVTARVAARIRERRRTEWEAIFSKTDACVTPVLTPAEALAHPHHRARGLVHRRGKASLVGPFAQMSGGALSERPAPAAGQHTRAILAEAGCAAEQIDQLLAAGVVREPQT